MRGAQQQIASQLSPAVAAAGASAGATLGGSILSSVGKAIQVGAATAVGAAATTLGVALTKGFTRLNQIDQATAKLRGLGNSASNVSEIMSDALASVKGTAFGLGDAATVAAQAVAAGIQPGTQLTATLKAVANSAAASGTDLNSMGSIFAQVAATGKAYNGQLQQLADRGVPIYQALAKQLHTTTQGVFDLSSQGKISFQQFQDAATAASGNVAAAMGTTLKGALDNLGASLGRIGAGLEGGIFPQLAPMITGLTQALAPLETVAANVGNVIGTKLNPVFQGFSNLLKGGLPDLSSLAGILGPLAGAFAAIGAGGLAGLFKDIPLLQNLVPGLSALGGPIGIIAAAFAGLVAVSPQLRQALGGLLTSLGGALVGAFQGMAPTLKQIMTALSSVAKILGGVLAEAVRAVTPFLVQLVQIFAGALAAVLPTVVPIIKQLGTVFGQLAAALLPLITQVLSALMPIIVQLVPPLVQLTKAVLSLISPLLTALMPIMKPLIDAFSALLPPIIAIITPLIQLLVPAIQLVASWLTTLSTFLKDVFTGNWSGAWQTIMSSWQPVLQFIIDGARNIQSFFQGVLTFFTNIFTGNWSAAWGQIRDFAVTAFNGIRAGVNAVIGWIGGVGQSILHTLMNSFGGVASWLLQVGRDLINGLINGVKEVAVHIADAVLGPIKGAVSAVKSFLGIHSPSRLFRDEIGKQIVAGWALGITGNSHLVTKAMNDLTTVPTINASATSSFGAPSGRGGDVYIDKVVAPDQDPRVSGRIMARQVVQALAG